MTALPLITDRTLPDVMTGAGVLTCVRGNLPLIAMDVNADLTGLVAGTTVRQTFHNPHRSPIEATYIFPLPDRAAVTGLTVTIGDRRIIGRLEERQAARNAYDAATEAGLLAAIVEEERPDVFTTRIGNLAAGEQAIIELSLAGPVPCEFGEATFRVPLVVAPRYIPGVPIEGDNLGAGVALDTDAVPDASRISPPVLLAGLAAPVRLSLRVTIDPAGLEVVDLCSSLHAVTAAGELPGPVTIELHPGHRLDRDFVLRYRVGTAQVGVAALAVADRGDRDRDEGTFVVTVTPPATSGPPLPRDVVLVLDRSGSMGGWKMVAARRAAARIIDALTSADRFAVMAFDHVVERPPALDALPALAPATDRNRYQAIEWLGRLEARGGTEMLLALSLARRALASADGRNGSCILVTDGQVGNEDQLLAAVQGMRVFAVGIDQAVNAGLLHRLAGANGGRCELVESEDRLDHVMTDLQRGIANPVLEAVTVRFEGLDVLAGSITPPRPADVFAGVPLVISGRFRGAPGGRAVVEMRQGDGQALLAPVVSAANHAAAPIWARGHLRDLEDRYVAGGAGYDRDALATEITATSLRHRVLCRFTAFVAVDEAGRPVGGELHRIVQPVDSPAGWSGARAGVAYAAGDPAVLPLWVGPPQPVPAYQPVRPTASPPPFRGRRLTPSSKPIDAPASTVSPPTDSYRERLEALLAGVVQLAVVRRSPDQTDDQAARLADAARQLVKELVAGGRSGPVLEALEALAAVLSAGDLGGAGAAGGRLRAALGWDDRSRSERPRRFWR